MAVKHQLVDRRRDARRDRGRGRDIGVDVLVGDRERSVSGEREPAGEQLEEHHAGRVDVAARTGGPAGHLLRRHVRDRADERLVRHIIWDGARRPGPDGDRPAKRNLSVMTESGRVIVAGAGLAGFRTVEELRERGFAGPITLVGAEPRPPSRPAAAVQEVPGRTRSPTRR